MELKKQVECITTGEVFGCARMAAERYSISDYRNINKACNGKRKSAGRGQDGKPLEWRYVNTTKELKNSQDGVNTGVKEGSGIKKLKASDFDLDFKGRKGKKNKAFLMKYATLDYMDYDEIDKLEKRMSQRLSATEKSMRKEWHDKHYDMSQIDKIMQGNF